MHDRLSDIIQTKEKEVAILKEKIAQLPHSELAKAMRGEIEFLPKKNVYQALAFANHIKVIAEIKRRSPAKGDFADIMDPVALAKQYIIGGASVISVLTDEAYFGGNLTDLQAISSTIETAKIPVLRKDFLIDPIQIAESLIHGADIILLIAAALGDQLPYMLKKAREFNVPALVEVYKRKEIQPAIDAGAEIIGVNNRNLKSFALDTQVAFELAEYLPKTAIKVAASGIFETTLAKQYHQAGYAAVLVGESLVKASNPAAWIAACNND